VDRAEGRAVLFEAPPRWAVRWPPSRAIQQTDAVDYYKHH
jgi:hypothetical protein